MKVTLKLAAETLMLETPAVAETTDEEMVKRGEYLVATSGCND